MPKHVVRVPITFEVVAEFEFPLEWNGTSDELPDKVRRAVNEVITRPDWWTCRKMGVSWVVQISEPRLVPGTARWSIDQVKVKVPEYQPIDKALLVQEAMENTA